ncbi:MAG: hypothetical protein KAG95_00020 [Bacteroidales bacterium]|nr:hypothetical protein [Bacteroidales bacterium]
MKIKTFLKLTLIMFAITLFVSCSSESKKGTTNGKDNEQVEEKVTKGEITDEIYVEISAQLMYISTKYAIKAENIETIAGQVAFGEEAQKEIEAVFNKYGVNEDNLNEYSKKFEENPLSIIKLTQAIAKRVAELKKEDK